MAKFIDSGALTLMNRVLGLAGGGGAQRTELEDGLVNQTIDIGPVVRRSRSLNIDGIFSGVFRFGHGAGSTTLSRSVDPWALGTTIARAPFPPFIPEGFDLWLLSCSGRITAGTDAEFGSAALILEEITPKSPAFGISHDGATIAGQLRGIMNVALFTGIAVGGNETWLVNAVGGHSFQKINTRIPRNSIIKLVGEASGAVTYQVDLVLQLVPSTLGQDAVT